MTLIELIVVIASIILLSILFVPRLRNGADYGRLHCVNNLKQLGLAYRIWAGDNHDEFPMNLSLTNGGTRELMGTEDAWRTYQVMSNELSTARILWCPADEGRPVWATNFSDDLRGKMSYFIGLEAGTNSPQAFLSGDDNLAIAGRPVKPGLISLSPSTAASWTAGRHALGGTVGLADGSVQVVKNVDLPVRISQTGLATNRLVIP